MATFRADRTGFRATGVGLVRRLGLRARVTLAFFLGTLLVTGLLSVATLGVSRQVLLDQRENAATDVAVSNAAIILRNTSSETEVAQMEQNLTFLVPADSFPLVRLGDAWLGQDVSVFGQDDVPVSLAAQVTSDQAAVQRATVKGEPMYVVGIPIPRETDGLDIIQYYEAFRLSDTDETLTTLGLILAGTSTAATVFAALLGYWAARQTLRPLTEVGDAARALEAGRLETRIEPPADTDLAALVSAFNDMAGALEARIERDGRFASEVSHELRSPLMTLTASLEVLENSRADLTERAATALDLLSSDIDRFKVLVEDLLEISRFDVGTASLELSEIHLPEFLRQTIRYAGAAARLHVPPDRADLVVVADKRRLARVMSNLLDNAAKYGGGATDVSLRVDTSTVAIVIDDEGPGVPPQERAVIFDRFSRGGAGGRRGSDTGVGLGLAMVDEDVNLHGGRVWVTDRPGDTPGARFVVELPRSLEIPE